MISIAVLWIGCALLAVALLLMVGIEVAVNLWGRKRS